MTTTTNKKTKGLGMPKKQKADARIDEIKERFLERAEELWELHESEFMQILEDAESHKVNLTFSAELDFSESTAKLTTQIRFSVVHKDKKQDDFDDPNQPALPGTEFESAAKSRKGKVKKRKKTETTDEISGKEAASGAGKDA